MTGCRWGVVVFGKGWCHAFFQLLTWFPVYMCINHCVCRRPMSGLLVSLALGLPRSFLALAWNFRHGNSASLHSNSHHLTSLHSNDKGYMLSLSALLSIGRGDFHYRRTALPRNMINDPPPEIDHAPDGSSYDFHGAKMILVAFCRSRAY